MFLNDQPPIAGGRELWSFPKKLAEPTLKAEIDTLVGTLHFGPLLIATGTMGYKHTQADLAAIKTSLLAPNSCSRSSRMSMARRESVSWWNITWRISI